LSVLVLVVDDEPDVEALFRQQFRRDLRAQRFVMDFAMSAADALARVAGTIEQSLILILSDINMPRMGGIEFYRVLRQNPRWLLIPFIFLTAGDSPDEIRLGRSLGVEDYLTKPIESADLIKAPVIAVGITTTLGTVLYATSTELLDITMAPLTGIQNFEFDLAALPLSEGEYSIQAMLSTSEGVELHSVPQAARFSVQGKSRSHGPLAVETEFVTR